jgi:hypothetical protein
MIDTSTLSEEFIGSEVPLHNVERRSTKFV